MNNILEPLSFCLPPGFSVHFLLTVSTKNQKLGSHNEQLGMYEDEYMPRPQFSEMFPTSVAA
jgi:hypothetical protein